ncbi:hypothetical protein B0H13DRAFT_2324681 [Mycena leptocephala]|nr:hypothetical protein B0H13DRAFT_2324681 [Mycena leptocephala]
MFGAKLLLVFDEDGLEGMFLSLILSHPSLPSSSRCGSSPQTVIYVLNASSSAAPALCLSVRSMKRTMAPAEAQSDELLGQRFRLWHPPASLSTLQMHAEWEAVREGLPNRLLL